MRRAIPVALAIVALVAARPAAQSRPPGTVRIATFNVFELSCEKVESVDAQGRRGEHPQLRKAAAIIRHVAPDIILINEIDYSLQPNCAQRFSSLYLENPRESLAPLTLPHLVYLPVNTGVASGLDLNRNGRTGDPEDAFGYGRYPGQYGMALFSRYPVDAATIRTFQRFPWRDLPGHHMPDGREGRPAHYAPEVVGALRLSSKSHWDVPVTIGGRVVHLLASHPTPPIFDGPEDANGRRAFDEIRFWADYITGGSTASYVVDDRATRGGLAPDASFIVLGDLNADPLQDARAYGRSAASQLLEHPRVQDPKPVSAGQWTGDRPGPYPGDIRLKTSGFGRIDYVLPSRDLEVAGSGVWYPADTDPLHALVAPPDPASDHALVWIDLRVPR